MTYTYRNRVVFLLGLFFCPPFQFPSALQAGPPVSVEKKVVKKKVVGPLSKSLINKFSWIFSHPEEHRNIDAIFQDVRQIIIKSGLSKRDKLEFFHFFESLASKHWSGNAYRSRRAQFLFSMADLAASQDFAYLAGKYWKKTYELSKDPAIKVECLLNSSRLKIVAGENKAALQLIRKGIKLSNKARLYLMTSRLLVMELKTRYRVHTLVPVMEMNRLLPDIKLLLQNKKGYPDEVMALLHSLDVKNTPREALALLNKVNAMVPADNHIFIELIDFLTLECLIELGMHAKAEKSLQWILETGRRENNQGKIENATALLQHLRELKDKKKGVSTAGTAGLTAGEKALEAKFKSFVIKKGDQSAFFNQTEKLVNDPNNSPVLRRELINFMEVLMGRYWKKPEYNSTKAILLHIFGDGLMNLEDYSGAEKRFQMALKLTGRENYRQRTYLYLFLARLAILGKKPFQAHQFALQ
ncbi:hypothetical protein ACFL35_21080, partial [Candidatus Riflebacteria bacterium]